MSKEPEARARGPAARRVIDWHQGAEMLARGMTAHDVAKRLGCAPATLSHKRKHDPVFQGWLARCSEEHSARERERLAVLRPNLQRTIEGEVGAGNVRVILWLADRLKLVNPPNEHTPQQELRSILEGLTCEELKEFEQLRDEA